jgi:hypothetical protein
MRRPQRLKLFDADRIDALGTRCTEQRERAEKAEALTVLLRSERDTAEDRIERANQIFRDILAMDKYEEVAMPKVLAMARNWLGLPCAHENTVVEMRGSRRLVDGQVDDDLHEVEVCKDCGADLPLKKKPLLYTGSPTLRDWADMHGELHEEKP